MNSNEKPSSTSGNTLQLDPIMIPGHIAPLQSEGADVGVNYHLIHANTQGLPIVIQPYLNMQEHDWIEVFWGDSGTAVASGMVTANDLGKDFGLFVRASRIPEGIHELYCTVTRPGGGNGGESPPLAVLVRTEFPGGTDPEPDLPGHQNLLPPEPDLPPGGIVDEEAAKNGIRVVIPGYRNMRVYDRLTFSWGGELIRHEVTQDEVDAAAVELLVTEATILAAGDSDQLVLVYSVVDEVHNQASEWSMRTTIIVEVGEGLFDGPVIVNPDPATDLFDLIDLDLLGDDDLMVEVYAERSGDLLAGDVIALTWLGTSAEGLPISVTPAEQSVPRVPSRLDFVIPNASVRGLAHGHGVASYSVSRDGSPAGVSRRSFASFIGSGQRLPKPTVVDATGDTLDPALDSTTVIVDGAALEAGDTVVLTWLGTRANGTPLLREWRSGVSGGNAGKPMAFPIPGAEFIAPLDGGTLSVYYRLIKRDGLELDSDRATLRVGEARAELPAPTTRPAAVNGVLDPDDLPAQLQIVIPPWPDMNAAQTVYLLWRASNGPHHDDWMPISAPMEGHEVVFQMDRERVLENLDASIEVSYRVDSDQEPSRTSEVLGFTLEAAQQVLPLPLIVEAVGDQLDPNDVLEGATVRLAAEAQFAENDEVTVRIISTVEGGSATLVHVVSAAEAGQALELSIAHGVIDASSGTRIDLRYEISRAAGGPPEQSGTVGYLIYTSIDAGALRVMGARHCAGYYTSDRSPRMLTALNDDSLAPMVVEWRYEDEQQWTAATHWIDEKPALKLYVRSASETWECRPINVVGNGGWHDSAFVAMRDEVMGADGPEVDMVAWGSENAGGKLSKQASALTNVVEVVVASLGFAARLRDGNAFCWGDPVIIDKPGLIPGNFVGLKGSTLAFLGRQADGELYAWGSEGNGAPVPQEVLDHKDYVQFGSGAACYAARRASGHVVAWGWWYNGGLLRPGQDKFNDVVGLMSNGSAFVALRDSKGKRKLMAWGDDSYGADLPPAIASLTNVKALVAANGTVFCIQLETGEIRAWPVDNPGGEVPDEVASGTNVMEITATAYAFCARLNTGKVIAWGSDGYGGSPTSEVIAKSDIVQVTGNDYAFAALCRDGTVVAWGDSRYGGDTTKVVEKLVNVRAVYSNTRSFTALTREGHVVTWGHAPNGGDSSKVQHLLHGKVTHSRLLPPQEAQQLFGDN